MAKGGAARDEKFAMHLVIRRGGFEAIGCGRRRFMADGSQTRFATDKAAFVTCLRCKASSLYAMVAGAGR